MRITKNLLLLTYCIIALAIVPAPIGVQMPQVNKSFISGNTRSEVLEWKYQYKNGKLYRRLYNASTQKWVGDWELVG